MSEQVWRTLLNWTARRRKSKKADRLASEEADRLASEEADREKARRTLLRDVQRLMFSHGYACNFEGACAPQPLWWPEEDGSISTDPDHIIQVHAHFKPVRARCEAGQAALDVGTTEALTAYLDEWLPTSPAVSAKGADDDDDDDDDWPTSKRHQDHLWYEGHSELSWRDREVGQMYGMDVETYLSNYLND